MPPSNIQRFIVAFLVVATLTSSGIFAFSLYNSRPKTLDITSAGNGTNGAFVEKLPSDPSDPDWQAATADGANLTGDIANVLAKAIVDSNPEGPLERNGTSTILLPKNATSVIEKYLATQKAPDIFKDKIDTSKFHITSDNDESLVRYGSEIQVITSAMMSEAQTSSDNPEEIFMTANAAFTKAYKKLLDLKVPESAVEFHSALISLIVVPNDYSNAIINDPFAAAVAQDEFDHTLTERMIALDASVKKLKNLPISQANPGFIGQILGVKTALAIIPVVDWVAIIRAIKAYMMELARDWQTIAIGYLKNQLMKKLTSQVVNWALGQGKPQFVDNWQGFINDTVQDAAGEVIESVAPSLCGGGSNIGAWVGVGNISEFIRRIMTPVNVYDYSSRTTCTLDKVVDNVQDFANDLRNGGWISYSALLEPQNTLFGGLMLVSDMQLRKASEMKEAALSKAVAGQGYTGTEICDNGQPPKSIATKTLNGAAGTPIYQCEDGSTPHITTPGANTSAMVSRSFDSAYQRITAANDWKPLVQFLIDAEISRLVNAGVKGIFNYKSGGGGSSSGGTTGSGSGPTTPSSDVEELAKQILELKKLSLQDAKGAAGALQETVNTLTAVAAGCGSSPSVVAEAQATAPALITALDNLNLKIRNISTIITMLERFISEISSKKYTLADLTAKFGTFAQARKEADDMYQKRNDAEDAYMNAQELYSSCISSEPIYTSTSTDSGSSTSTLP